MMAILFNAFIEIPFNLWWKLGWGPARPSPIVLPVHQRHPGAELAPLVEAPADAPRQRFGLETGHLHLDQRRGRAALLHQLDAVRGGERLQRLADGLHRYVFRQIADHYAHGDSVDGLSQAPRSV